MNTALLGRLEQFRRRASLAAAAGIGAHAVVAAAAMALVAARFVDPVVAIAGCAALAAATTVTLTILRRPPLAVIAAAVDRHAALDDRVLTAFEHRNDSDPFGQLLLRDAAARAAVVSPAAVFPLRLPRRLWLTATLAAVVTVLAVLTPGGAVTSAPSAATSGRDGGDASGTPRQGQPREPAGTPPEGATLTPQKSRAQATPEVAAPAADRPPMKPTPTAAAAARDGRLGARADAAGATARTDGAGGLGAQRGNATGPTTASGPGAERRIVMLTSTTDTSGQRQIPAGLRAYVRSYFEAINK